MSSRRVCLVGASFLACVVLKSATAAGDGSRAIKADGCFTRTYDAAHLRAHAGQKTLTAEVRFQQRDLQLALAESGREHLISATCSWAMQAGRDIKGKSLLPAFKGRAAYDCIVTYSEESAEEGGYLIFAPAPDATSATVYVDSPVAARTTWQGKARSIALGPEDRVFKLMQAPAAACRAFER